MIHKQMSEGTDL